MMDLSRSDLEKLKKSSEDNIIEHKKMLALNELMVRVAIEELDNIKKEEEICQTETILKEEEKSIK